MFEGSYPGIGTISWTDRPYRGYFGKHLHDSHNILINSVLNSVNVNKETIKFVLYHEMLHRDMPYHDKDFRDEEHKYPRWQDHDNFLHETMNKFDIKEW